MDFGVSHKSHQSLQVSLSIDKINLLRKFRSTDTETNFLTSGAALDDKSQYPLFGRTVPNDDGTAIPLVVKLKEWGVRYLAVLYADDAYGNAFAKGIPLAAKQYHPDLEVATVDFRIGADAEQVAKSVDRLVETQYTYFFGIVWDTDLDKIMTECYNRGIAGTGKHVWLFSDSVGSHITDGTFDGTLGKAYHGTSLLSAVGGIPGELRLKLEPCLSTTYFILNPCKQLWNFVQGMENYDKLATAMRELRSDDKNIAFLNDHLPIQEEEGEVIVNYTSVTSEDSFLEAPGLVAPFLYDAVVGLGLSACELSSPENGGHLNFTGQQLYDAFLNTTFKGTSGSIVLNPDTGTRDPGSASFLVTNFVAQTSPNEAQVALKGVETDLFSSGDWLSLVPYTFSDGTSVIPPDLPELHVETNHLSTGLKVVGSLLCGIIIAISLAASIWTYSYRQKRVVRSAQPIFLQLIAAGTLFMGCSIIPLTIEEGGADQEGANAACMSFPWLLAIGFSLTFSALFTKTHRITKILSNAARFKRVTVTALDVAKPMAALLVANIVVLTTWTIMDPLQREIVIVSEDNFGRPTETYGVCNSEHATIFLSVLCVINIGSLLYALLEAWRARKVSTELSESSYIFTALGLVLVATLFGIPVIIISSSSALRVSAYYFVTSGIIFVVCTSIILLIFLPKVKALNKPSNSSTVSSFGGGRPTVSLSRQYYVHQRM